MGESRGRSRVGVVVRRDVDGLDAGHSTPRCRGNALLELAHLGGQSRLVAHGGGHTTQKSRNLGARLRETKDVVDKQQGIGSGLITQVLGHGQRRQRHPQSGAGRLVHLPKDHDSLIDDALTGIPDLGLLHLEPQVVALAGPLADAGEARITAVEAGQASDELLDDHGLADAGTTKQPSLATANQRTE